MFDFIPAIDLYEKKIVRLYQGSYDQKKDYYQDPLFALNPFIEARIKKLHVVDLNASRESGTGQRKNRHSTNFELLLSIIKRAQEEKIEVQLGGGLRTLEDMQKILDLGINRLILGTIAIQNFSLVEEALSRFGAKKILIGIDERQNKIQISGWEKESSMHTKDFLPKLESSKVQNIIWTDISKDGTLAGPNWNSLESYLKMTSLNFILSGGVASIQDIKTAVKLSKLYPHFSGVISGKAIYENKINVKEAMSLCSQK